jgi:hypothetical protein
VGKQAQGDTELEIEYERILTRVKKTRESVIRMDDRRFTTPVDEISGTVDEVSPSGIALKEYPGRRFQFSSCRPGGNIVFPYTPPSQSTTVYNEYVPGDPYICIACAYGVLADAKLLFRSPPRSALRNPKLRHLSPAARENRPSATSIPATFPASRQGRAPHL